MSNLALYRKYRSKDFDEVVGQSHIVDVLKNAITSGRHSHAYLLTGPRGVGKTTVARLIAKSLNGLRKDEAIADHLDIVEIDGASNRGIDEIRKRLSLVDFNYEDCYSILVGYLKYQADKRLADMKTQEPKNDQQSNG